MEEGAVPSSRVDRSISSVQHFATFSWIDLTHTRPCLRGFPANGGMVLEQTDKHLLSHLPPPAGLLVHTTSRLFMVPESKDWDGEGRLYDKGWDGSGQCGRVNQEAGLGPGCPGPAWSLSKVRAPQAAAPGRDS